MDSMLSRRTARRNAAPLNCPVNHPILGGVVLGLFMMISGCGSGTESTVSGRVTLDGTALEKGIVLFMPTPGGSGKAATGVIDSGGDYWVQVAMTGGLPAGEYSVSVTSSAPPKPSRHGGPPGPGKLLTPKRYARPKTSGFTFQIAPGSNDIDLELTTK